MFRRSNEIVFSPSGRRRSRRLPAWLIWLLVGLVAGAGGLLFVQERYLPQRLSASASAQMVSDFQRAETERLRLASEVARAGQQLAALQADREGLARDLVTSRAAVQQLQGDLVSVVDALPADPRKGVVEVRAARFASSAGMLDYDLVLTRERAGARPLVGSVQLLLTGDSPQRGDASVSLKPIALSIARQQVLRGSLPLPEGFRPRQTTVQVLEGSSDKIVGMRILVLK